MTTRQPYFPPLPHPLKINDNVTTTTKGHTNLNKEYGLEDPIVNHWQSFQTEVTNYLTENFDAQREVKFDKKMEIGTEAYVKTAFFRNVLSVIKEQILEILEIEDYFFAPEAALAHLKAGYILIKSGILEYYLVFEIKNINKLRKIERENLVDAFNFKNPTGLELVRQLYTHMSWSGTTYGVISSYEKTWVFKRLGNNLLISPVIYYHGQNPTVLEAVCFAVNMSLTLPGTLNVKGKMTMSINGKMDINIEYVQFIANGLSGTVMEIKYGHSVGMLKRYFAHKVFEKKDKEKMYVNEIHIYEKLKTLQGKCIPKLIEQGTINEFPAIIVQMCGTKINHMRINDEDKRNIEEAVDQIHNHKVLHNDLRKSNILKDNKGTIKIIDFGISEDCDDCKKLQEEKIKLIQNLYQNYDHWEE